jgi:2-keto-4-pentenoate hydratase
VDSRLVRATVVQHRRRQRSLAHGAHHVGWKVGAGDREFLGGMSVGFLTSETQLRLGGVYPPGPREQLHADAEVAVLIGPDGQPAGYACALELCDLAGDDGPEVVVANNVFHRAFALGPVVGGTPKTGRLLIDGRVSAEGPVADDLAERVDRVRAVLQAVGENLLAADLVITGSIVQHRVVPGEQVRAEVDDLGSVTLSVGSPPVSPAGSTVAARRRARSAPAPGTPGPG